MYRNANAAGVEARMPISKYNKFYGGGASKARNAMIKEYGKQKGERIFYALANKRKAQLEGKKRAGKVIRGKK